MSDNSGIEWTESTWSPTKGCDRVSPGCDHCYAMTMAKRLKGMGSPEYQQDGNPATSGPGFFAHESPNDLDWPLRKTKPRLIFVNSMSDLFHDNISDEFIAQVFAVMALAPQHTFQVLTKRHARMRALLSKDTFNDPDEGLVARALYRLSTSPCDSHLFEDWPLRNVWLGVSVENQQWADIRIPALLETPAAVRFLSCEPLLENIEIEGDLYPGWRGCASTDDWYSPGIDWVIAGGESGPGARPMALSWARSLRDQCTAAEVPFLFKQWGSHDEHGTPMNKHKAGRILDGRTWDQYPEAVSV